MMRKGAFIMGAFMIAALSLTLAGCKAVVGNGDVVTREIALKTAVTGVRSSGPFDVVIDPSLKGKAILEGESNILDFVEAYQDEAGGFNLGLQRDVNILSDRGVTARIPEVRGGELVINGSGSITLAGSAPLTGNSFQLRINGSGGINLAFEAQRLKCDILGTGNITVKGSAKEGDVEINGSGNYNAADLKTEKSVVRILGSGSARVDAREELECHILGSGNVLYRSDPPKLKVDSRGSGTVNPY